MLAGLAPDMAVYPWSSHAHHLGLRKQAWLKDHAVYWALGNTPFDREAAFQQLCEVPPDPRIADAIEAATRKAWALGGEAFKASLAKLTDRRLQPARRGRPPRRVEALPANNEPALTPPGTTKESTGVVRTAPARRRTMASGQDG